MRERASGSVKSCCSQVLSGSEVTGALVQGVGGQRQQDVMPLSPTDGAAIETDPLPRAMVG